MRRLIRTTRHFFRSWTAQGADLQAVGFTLAILVIAFAYYVWSFGSLQGFVTAIDKTDLLFGDFTNHYYPAGREVYASGKPWPGYYYSAFFALCLGAFSVFPLVAAQWLWGVCQIAVFALMLLIPAGDLLRRSRWLYYLWVVLLALSMPVLHNFKWGQISTLIVVCLMGTLYLYRRGWTRSASVLLALATTIKFYPGIFILYFVVKRQWRFVIGFAAATVLFFAVVPAAMMGPTRAYAFMRTARNSMARLHAKALRNVNSQHFPTVMARLSRKHLQNRPNWQMLRNVGYGLFAANVLLLLGLTRMKPDDEACLAFALLFLSLPLLVETSWPHYFAYMPFCQVVTCMAIRRRGSAWWQGLILIGGLVPSAILSSMPFFNWVGHWPVYSPNGYLLLADLLLLATIYLYVIALALAQWRTGRPPAAETRTQPGSCEPAGQASTAT